MIQIKKINVEETYPIRLEVLRKNIPLPFKFNGDFDKNTFHLGAFKNEKLIAISSYMKVNNKNFIGSQYQLRGMATLKEYEGMGAGKLMLLNIFSILKELKINYLWCNARILAVPFYKKQGFYMFGNKFEIPVIGTHYVLFKKLLK